ncbi:MAG TPA: metal-dependent hydrolase [Blastocatellia bacterium]|nr:metal-dependent hydrolase [Blastocatellia bacterium]
MATIFSHAVCAAAAGMVFATLPRVKSCEPMRLPVRFRLLAAGCAVLPDADVAGFAAGVRYGDVFGHRGLTHSILFALVTGLLVARIFFRNSLLPVGRMALASYFSLMTLSHGCLDAMTDGGLGVAFFAPFDNTRYFFPWRPIEVSPIGARFFSARGIDVMLSELEWIWLPSLMTMAICALLRQWRMKERSETD